METFDNKAVLITGASGLVGYTLVTRLLKYVDVKVIVCGRNYKKLENTFSEYLSNPSFSIYEHDVSNPFPNLSSNIDCIFHAAGPMERSIVLNKPVSVINPNLLGTINCMDFLKQQYQNTGVKGRLVVFSSVSVYSNNTTSDVVVSEKDTNMCISLDNPMAVYSESKRMSELIALSFCKQFGLDAVIARLSTVYGYSKNIPDTAFFEFIKNALKGECIRLGNGKFPKRDNIYVDDAVEGLLTMKGVSGEVYNISSNGKGGNFAAVDEIAEIISSVVANIYGIPRVDVLKPISSVSNRCFGVMMDNSKLIRIGWQLNTAIETGITETVSKMADNHY